MFQKNGFSHCSTNLTDIQVENLRNQWMAAVKNFLPYPEGKFQGKGIVMCAGGIRYFTCAWITIRQLRASGCQLPVEVWYGGSELNISSIQELNKLQVACRNLHDFGHYNVSGFAKKSLAILHSSFQEVLFMDADNHCLGNPLDLFEIDGYHKTGAVFWPDFWTMPPQNPIWKILNLEYVQMREQESGQMLIDKRRCWYPLQLCIFLNTSSELYYKLLYGDKDTFRFAWMALKQGFHFIQDPPNPCGYLGTDGRFLGMTMVQYDESAEPLFLHRNLLKWDVTGANERAWKFIKQFQPYNDTFEYLPHFSISGNHMSMDLGGACRLLEAGPKIVKLEEDCLKDLETLRNSSFYARLLLHSHVRGSRFRGTEQNVVCLEGD